MTHSTTIIRKPIVDHHFITGLIKAKGKSQKAEAEFLGNYPAEKEAESLSNLATKDDIQNLKNDIKNLRTELKAEINAAKYHIIISLPALYIIVKFLEQFLPFLK